MRVAMATGNGGVGGVNIGDSGGNGDLGGNGDIGGNGDSGVNGRQWG